jgi:hypothetical protein
MERGSLEIFSSGEIPASPTLSNSPTSQGSPTSPTLSASSASSDLPKALQEEGSDANNAAKETKPAATTGKDKKNKYSGKAEYKIAFVHFLVSNTLNRELSVLTVRTENFLVLDLCR